MLVRASTKAYEELARATVSKGTTRSFPAYSQGQLFFRSNQGRSGILTALDLR